MILRANKSKMMGSKFGLIPLHAKLDQTTMKVTWNVGKIYAGNEVDWREEWGTPPTWLEPVDSGKAEERPQHTAEAGKGKDTLTLK